MNSVSSVAEREKGGKGEREQGYRSAVCKTSPALPLSRSPFPILFLFLLSAVLLGCEEDVPTASTDLPFEVYGVLNPAADTQRVRVFPIQAALEGDTTGAPLDAVVTSTDLETGETLRWRDSLLVFSDGTYGHVFWAAFRPEGGHTYRVDVTRSDGARSSAAVRVPYVPRVLDPSWQTLPALLGGGTALLQRVEIEYEVQYCYSPAAFIRVALPYEMASFREGDWHRVDFIPVEDYPRVEEWMREEELLVPRHGLILRSARLHAVVTDAGWEPPGGAYDPEVLIEPGLMSNVENGLGFIGAGYDVHEPLEVPSMMRQEAGFLEQPLMDPPRGEPFLCPFPS